MNDIILNDNFKKFLENLTALCNYLEEKNIVAESQNVNFEVVKSLLKDLSRDNINIIPYDFALIKMQIGEVTGLDNITDEAQKKDCEYMLSMIQAALEEIIERINEFKAAGTTEYFYTKTPEIQYIPPAQPPTPLEVEAQEQMYTQTLSGLYAAMRQDCSEYLKEYIAFSKKKFTDNSWEPEFQHLEALYAQTRTKMEKTFGQITGRLRDKECIIEVRQRALKTPMIVSLQNRIANNPPKKPKVETVQPPKKRVSKDAQPKPKRELKKSSLGDKKPTKSTKAEVLAKGEQLVNQIHEVIYRTGHLPYDNEFNENRLNSIIVIREFYHLTSTKAKKDDLQVVVDKLEKLYADLHKTFTKVEAARAEAQRKVDEALQRKREYDEAQKKKVLDNKKLNKLFFNHGKRIGKYTKFLLQKETQPYLKELKKVQFEYGYSNPEYQAVANQFIEYASQNLGKRKMKKLIKELQKANITLVGANRTEIPTFLLDPEVLAHTSDGKKR